MATTPDQLRVGSACFGSCAVAPKLLEQPTALQPLQLLRPLQTSADSLQLGMPAGGFDLAPQPPMSRCIRPQTPSATSASDSPNQRGGGIAAEKRNQALTGRTRSANTAPWLPLKCHSMPTSEASLSKGIGQAEIHVPPSLRQTIHEPNMTPTLPPCQARALLGLEAVKTLASRSRSAVCTRIPLLAVSTGPGSDAPRDPQCRP
ncbi:hypothetical protein S7711_11300 [Stachybotrys chartarum IBT 7711]|uniref:Uncharacterized protein n=1 Tax=Stachybotrys chartarum (strain CBS 109288 / IBT 7711) TaxID=1280523 RepID=A0A084AYU4_STACB|nr:hypothetical protein S7711_11300 [Stachybotrys chartarum IBT 7711]KFA49299.1 hypothetical protein S40293_11227 [Stachybotrys chartarum IBT 40293]